MDEAAREVPKDVRADWLTDTEIRYWEVSAGSRMGKFETWVIARLVDEVMARRGMQHSELYYKVCREARIRTYAHTTGH